MTAWIESQAFVVVLTATPYFNPNNPPEKDFVHYWWCFQQIELQEDESGRELEHEIFRYYQPDDDGMLSFIIEKLKVGPVLLWESCESQDILTRL